MWTASIRSVARSRAPRPRTTRGQATAVDVTTPENTAAALTLRTSIILTRAPLLTNPPTAFEAAYYDYQSRLSRTLSSPFPADFYFKKGSLLERRFNAEERIREAQTFGEDFVALEDTGDVEKLEDIPSEEEDVKLLERETDADRLGNLEDLNRRGNRSLYLLIRTNHGGKPEWSFPHWEVGYDQPLHTSTREALTKTFGLNMNTWIVGRQPISFRNETSTAPTSPSAKTFFFKGHILAGRPTPEAGILDLAWLTKEEVQERVTETYWQDVQELLPRV